MQATATKEIPIKSTEKKSKISTKIKDIKISWKNIKFLSKKQVFKRLAIVTIAMVIISAIILAVDSALDYGFSFLKSFDHPTIKMILTVVFLCVAVIIIISEIIRKSKTKGFNLSYMRNNKISTVDDIYDTIIRISGIIEAILLIIIYIL